MDKKREKEFTHGQMALNMKVILRTINLMVSEYWKIDGAKNMKDILRMANFMVSEFSNSMDANIQVVLKIINFMGSEYWKAILLNMKVNLRKINLVA